VLVMPIQIDRSKGLDIASGEELTELMVNKLQSHKVRTARFEGESGMAVDFRLACEVPELGYTEARGYPRRLHYKAELHCVIKDSASQAIRWKRELNQQYEESVLFNAMTKRPEHHDRVLYRECVVPLWDAMAYGVKLFLGRPALQAAPVPHLPEPALPEPSPYSK
jgi:hypothetical protein